MCKICTNIRISSRPTSADYLHLQIQEMGNFIRIQIVDNQGIMHVDNQCTQSICSQQHCYPLDIIKGFMQAKALRDQKKVEILSLTNFDLSSFIESQTKSTAVRKKKPR